MYIVSIHFDLVVTQFLLSLVFLTTAAWSAFAYIWLYIILVIFTPNVVTLWEAVITLLSFPVLVANSYMAEKNFFIPSRKEEEMQQLSDMGERTS